MNHPKASYEDVQYHLYILEKVKRGFECAETESAIPHVDAKARLGRWLTPRSGRLKQLRALRQSLRTLSATHRGMNIMQLCRHDPVAHRCFHPVASMKEICGRAKSTPGPALNSSESGPS